MSHPNLIIRAEESKDSAVSKLKNYAQENGFTITIEDFKRPWGGFIHLDEKDIRHFAKLYFPEVVINFTSRMTPKLLLVAPHEILSWQYHHRRAEIWKIVLGDVQVVQSKNDSLTTPQIKPEGSLITHKEGVRHRLIGTDSWSVFAEIWQHTDPNNLSDEEDIVRLEDKYGR